MTIEVSGELEAALTAQALTAGKIARHVLAQALTPGVQLQETAIAPTGEEKARAFVHWAKSHRDTPPLSDEAVSRASMYPDHW